MMVLGFDFILILLFKKCVLVIERKCLWMKWESCLLSFVIFWKLNKVFFGILKCSIYRGGI